MRLYIVDKADKKVVNVQGSEKQYEQPAFYVVLCETEMIKDNKRVYEVRTLKEGELVEFALRPGMERINFSIVGKEVRNKDASLGRFRQKGYRIAPITVLTELHDSAGGLLGYRYASNNGTVFMRKTDDFLRDCAELIEKATGTRTAEAQDVFKPVQNMKYTPANSKKNTTGKAFVSIYSETNPLPVEIVVTRQSNKYAQPKEPQVEKNEENISSQEKLQSIFTKEQIAEIRMADKNKVDIRIIANPALSPEQMHNIWTIEALKLPARRYATPEYSADFMKFLGQMLQVSVDIAPVLVPEYDKEQALEILAGMTEGLDVSTYADPGNSADAMRRIRKDLYHGIWGASIITGSGINTRRVAKQLK